MNPYLNKGIFKKLKDESLFKSVKVSFDTVKTYTCLDKSNSFTRRRKMLLADTILCILSKKGLTTTMELHQYFFKKGADHMGNIKTGIFAKKISQKI